MSKQIEAILSVYQQYVMENANLKLENAQLRMELAQHQKKEEPEKEAGDKE